MMDLATRFWVKFQKIFKEQIIFLLVALSENKFYPVVIVKYLSGGWMGITCYFLLGLKFKSHFF